MGSLKENFHAKATRVDFELALRAIVRLVKPDGHNLEVVNYSELMAQDRGRAISVPVPETDSFSVVEVALDKKRGIKTLHQIANFFIAENTSTGLLWVGAVFSRGRSKNSALYEEVYQEILAGLDQVYPEAGIVQSSGV